MAIDANLSEFRNRFLKINGPGVQQIDPLVVNARKKISDAFLKFHSDYIGEAPDVLGGTDADRKEQARLKKTIDDTNQELRNEKQKLQEAYERRDKAHQAAAEAAHQVHMADANVEKALGTVAEIAARLEGDPSRGQKAQVQAQTGDLDALRAALRTVDEARRKKADAVIKEKEAKEASDIATKNSQELQAKWREDEPKLTKNIQDAEGGIRKLEQRLKFANVVAALSEFVRVTGIGAQILKLSTQLNRTKLDDVSRLLLGTEGVYESILLKVFGNITDIKNLANDTEGLRQRVLLELKGEPKKRFSQALVDGFVEAEGLKKPNRAAAKPKAEKEELALV